MRATILCLLTATYLYSLIDSLLAIIACLLQSRCASRGQIHPSWAKNGNSSGHLPRNKLIVQRLNLI